MTYSPLNQFNSGMTLPEFLTEQLKTALSPSTILLLPMQTGPSAMV